MKLRKAIKKIVALGTGATMLGATILGATAADLAQYPSPMFIKDGKFDGVIVVGNTAAASDVIGAVDIATSLQAESTTVKSVNTGGSSSTVTVEGDAKQIAKSSDPLNRNELLNDPISTLTKDDLNSLADGSFSNQKGTFKFNQYIDMPTSARVQGAVAGDDYGDDPATYLKFATGSNVYTYKLTFPTALESDIDSDNDLDDLDNKKINFLGKEYTITNTDLSSAGKLTIEMMGGAKEETMEEYTSSTITVSGVEYNVEVVAIGGSPVTAILKIDGQVTEKLEEGDTFKLNDGTEIGIKSLLDNEGTEQGGGDMVVFYLGAAKVTLEEGTWTADTWGSVKMGEDTVDAQVNFKGSNTSSLAKISAIEIKWDVTDDYFVKLGDRLSDRLEDDEKGNLFLENIDFYFGGVDLGTTEEIKFEPKSNLKVSLATKTDGAFSFTPFYQSGAAGDNVVMGEKLGKLWITNPNDDIEKDEYFAVSEGKYSHVIQVNKFSLSDKQVWFKNVATGVITKVSAGDCDGDNTDLASLILDGKTYQFYADCTSGSEYVNFEGFGTDNSGAGALNSVIYTDNGAKLVIGVNQTAAPNYGYVRIYDEELSDYTLGDYANYTQINFNQYSDKDELEIATINSINGYGPVFVSMDTVDELKVGTTAYGTSWAWSTSDNDKLTIKYPSKQAEYAVFVTSGATTSSTDDGAAPGTVKTTTVNPIAVGSAKLASEVSSLTAQNMIVVGGPCANAVAAQLMGNPEPCYTGFVEGEAIVKLYENGNKVAMLVAGATATDTRRATRVLADYKAYKLSGMEVKVKGTSTTFSDTTVSAVAAN